MSKASTAAQLRRLLDKIATADNDNPTTTHVHVGGASPMAYRMYRLSNGSLFSSKNAT